MTREEIEGQIGLLLTEIRTYKLEIYDLEGEIEELEKQLEEMECKHEWYVVSRSMAENHYKCTLCGEEDWR